MDEWSSYLFGLGHTSAGRSTSITPANAPSLRFAWVWKAAGGTQSGQPGGALLASPTVSGGKVFIGANTGEFYALDLTSGVVLWHQNLGWRPKLTCNARGITSTAAVAPDGQGRPTLYVGGGDGYLYALDAATGVQRWRTVVGAPPSTTKSDYYNWASPIVLSGHVYDGVSSMCDNPFVPGSGLEQFNRDTGQLENRYISVPPPALGGGVWTSPAADDQGNIFVTTGSGSGSPEADMYSLVRLDATTLAREDAWKLPVAERLGDPDWGSSPTVFTATLGGVETEMVAACNKNGILYAFRAAALSAGPVWQTRIGVGNADGSLACLPAPVWDGSHLIMGGPQTTIAGTTYKGSIRMLDPATGTFVWEKGLGAIVVGTPSVNASGVIAAQTYDSSTGVTNGTYVLDARNGAQLNFLSFANSKQFAQPVFVGNYLLMASVFGGLNAYVVTPSADTDPPSTPQNVAAAAAVADRVDVTWAASADNIGVTGYDVYRNGSLLQQLPVQMAFADTTVSAGTSYAYTIKARDAAGNTSPLSATATVTTPVLGDDFETGNLSRWANVRGITVQSTDVFAGTWSARVAAAGAISAATARLPTQLTTAWVDARVKMISRATSAQLLTFRTAGNVKLGTVLVAASGQLAVRDDIHKVTYRSSVALTPGIWHRLAFETTVNGADGAVAVMLDGSPVTALSKAVDLGTAPIARFTLGQTTTAATFTADVDNLTVTPTAP
jgi:outer membrane protein assembly factor BamB